jgi:hypothetical protein
MIHWQIEFLWFFLLETAILSPRASSFSTQTIPKSRVHQATKTNTNLHSEEHHNYDSFPKNLLASLWLGAVILVAGSSMPAPAHAASSVDTTVLGTSTWTIGGMTVEATQGIPAVTQSDLGTSVRRTIVRGAQFADTLDLQWERFSDSLRDEKKCDPRTNRRMFDNGVRRDGTRIGNPVLGALCRPDPIKPLNVQVATTVLDLAQQAVVEVTETSRTELQQRVEQVKMLVGPSFSRAVLVVPSTTTSLSSSSSSSALSSSNDDDETKQQLLRQDFNRDLYVQMRAYGELVANQRENAKQLDVVWGNKMLAKLAPNANRNDYTSPFPKPDPTDTQPYDEGALLDALGTLSVALIQLQEAGLIGHWEISIPEDDDWNVVTIAVDDDISIGGQILSRERNQPLNGSAVLALVKAAMEQKAKIPYKINAYFIDPTTTRQELYNPTQLLLSLSDLGQ